MGKEEASMKATMAEMRWKKDSRWLSRCTISREGEPMPRKIMEVESLGLWEVQGGFKVRGAGLARRTHSM